VKQIVQARLDAESAKMLDRLVRKMGSTPSEIVRQGIRLVAATQGSSGASRIAGIGAFSSGIPDLGSSKKHLEGFGR